MSTAQKDDKSTKLGLDLTDTHFRYSLYFNRYEICEIGERSCVLRFAYVGENFDTGELSICLSSDGVRHLYESSKEYVRGFAFKDDNPEFRKHRFGRDSGPPVFANFCRFARSGGNGEMAFYLLPLHDIAMVTSGKSTSEVTKAIPVALLHSEEDIHQNLTIDLLSKYTV